MTCSLGKARQRWSQLQEGTSSGETDSLWCWLDLSNQYRVSQSGDHSQNKSSRNGCLEVHHKPHSGEEFQRQGYRQGRKWQDKKEHQKQDNIFGKEVLERASNLKEVYKGLQPQETGAAEPSKSLLRARHKAKPLWQ